MGDDEERYNGHPDLGAPVRTRIDLTLAAEIWRQLRADVVWHSREFRTFAERLAALKRIEAGPTGWPLCGWGDSQCCEPAAFCDTADGRLLTADCLGSEDGALVELSCETHEGATHCENSWPGSEAPSCPGVAVVGWKVICEERFCPDGCTEDHGTLWWCAACASSFDGATPPDLTLDPHAQPSEIAAR